MATATRRFGRDEERNKVIVQQFLDNPNTTLQEVAEEYFISRARVGQILKTYFGSDWQKPKKKYVCSACQITFNTWQSNPTAKYCKSCYGKHWKGKARPSYKK
tara:strand:+ start:75 stop:383 length:309 start_codon:yes stop_codon:yes gene_type:complete